MTKLLDYSFLVKNENVKDFVNAFRYCGNFDWSFEEVDGFIRTVSFYGQTCDFDDEFMMNTIASFVENDSFIEMGDIGTRWRWLFKNGKMIKKEAKFTW